jgi:ABC-type phosphate transport system substrate-binding protein
MRSASVVRLCLAVLFIVALLLAATSNATATNLYWYSPHGSNENCWQTGSLGAESLGCDTVGSGFLATAGGNNGGLAHMANLPEFAGGEDALGFAKSGDYCNYYDVGDDITDQETNNQGGYTGWEPPTPYGSYQESDAHGNACQANASTWGNEVRDSVSGNKCSSACGMQHYVSLREQGLNDRPWQSAFGAPSLVLSTEALLWAFETSGEDVGDWGYTCPQIEEINTGAIIEYCLQEWRSTFNEEPNWQTEGVKECNGWDGHTYDEIQTFAYTGTVDSTERGSAKTEELKSKSSWKHFEIAITRANLENAINQVNSTCHRGLPNKPENWALLGVEQGIEGWRDLKLLGGASANLSLRTEYTPLAPAVKTTPAEPITGTQATLRGSVEPNGSSINSFEYGTTPSLGSTVNAEPLSDTGTSTVNLSRTITGLTPGTTYYFRAHAWSPSGETSGETMTFVTPPLPTATTEAETEPSETQTTLHATVNPHGYDTHYYFQYGPTNSYGQTAPQPPGDAGSGTVTEPESATITGLLPGHTYYYRVVAESAGGVSYGGEASFRDLAPPPTLTLEWPTGITETETILNGTVNPNSAPTESWFEYGETPSLGSSTAEVHDGEGGSAVPVSAKIAGLHSGKIYYYQLAATNDGKLVYTVERELKVGEAKCSGTSILAQGSTLQALAQTNIWAPDFDTAGSAHGCNGTQGAKGRPTVTYSSIGSGPGMEEWGVGGHAFEAGRVAVVTTDEPINEKEKEEIESHEITKGSAPQSVETIPVLQASVAIIVHLPSNCTATSTGASGRLVLNNVTLEGIWKGQIRKWSEIKDDGDELKGTGCNTSTEITPVARPDRSGTTRIFKRYLDQIDESAIETEKGASKTWNELDEGVENTTWPKAAHVVKPASGGGSALVANVAELAGSIGYADLADARANGGFSKSGVGGPSTAKFWLEIQNNGVSTTKPKYEDPSTNGDAEAVANSNCATTTYTNGKGSPKFPPPSTSSTWNETTTETSEKHYTLCGLTYAMTLAKYSAYPGTTEGEAVTAKDYLQFVLDTTAEGGQKLIETHDYEGLPAKLLTEGEAGASETNF